MVALLSLGVIALSFASSVVRAQVATIQQIQDCGATLFIQNFDSTPTYSTGDSSPFVVRYAYDPALCYTPVQVPIYRIFLTDDSAGIIYQCPVPKFDASGFITSTFTKTKGQIAQQVADGDTDWLLSITVGERSFYLLQLNQAFYPTAIDPPTPSGDFRKRRRNLNTDLNCSNGQSWCRTGAKNFECLHTSTDVNACGACPYEDKSVDCTMIEGVDNVECKLASCHVNSCLRGYQVSPDRKTCIPQDRKVVIQNRRI